MKVTKKPKKEPRELTVSVREQFAELASYLNILLVERQTAIEAIMTALLTEQHVMLHGEPGVAKSMLASSVFNVIDGATLFEKQFMKRTKPEEVFGPLNLQKYQAESVWEHNVRGKLPAAHFAYLDEVYRASDMLLPACLGILNERRFENGTEVLRCPLITAVGTTNFKTEDEELDAFHDRWMYWVNVMPVTAVNAKTRMLQGYLERLSVEEPRKNFLTLDDLQVAIEDVRKIKVSKEASDAYAAIVSTVSSGLQRPISDRRFCYAIRAAQARAYLDGLSEVNEDCLMQSSFGLICRGDIKQEQAFDSAFTTVVTSVRKNKVESDRVQIIEDRVATLLGFYDPGHPTARKAKIAKKAEDLLTLVRDENFETQGAFGRMEKSIQRLTELIDSCAGTESNIRRALPDKSDADDGPKLTLSDIVKSVG